MNKKTSWLNSLGSKWVITSSLILSCYAFTVQHSHCNADGKEDFFWSFEEEEEAIPEPLLEPESTITDEIPEELPLQIDDHMRDTSVEEEMTPEPLEPTITDEIPEELPSQIDDHMRDTSVEEEMTPEPLEPIINDEQPPQLEGCKGEAAVQPNKQLRSVGSPTPSLPDLKNSFAPQGIQPKHLNKIDSIGREDNPNLTLEPVVNQEEMEALPYDEEEIAPSQEEAPIIEEELEIKRETDPLQGAATNSKEIHKPRDLSVHRVGVTTLHPKKHELGIRKSQQVNQTKSGIADLGQKEVIEQEVAEVDEPTAEEAPPPVPAGITPQYTKTVRTEFKEEKPTQTEEKQITEEIATSDDKSAGEKKYLIRFTNVSIISFLDYISKITDRNFIFDESDLEFNVTILSANPTSIDNIMTALLQELRVHNLSLLEVGNNLIIHRNSDAKSPARIVTDETEEEYTASDLITRVFTLSNSTPGGMAEIIRPMLSSLAIIESVPETGHLIVTDITPNINKIETLLDKLDTPALTFEIGQYTAVNADINMMVQIAERLLRPVVEDKPLEFVTHPVRGTIYVISTPHLVKRALSLLRDIDSPSSENSIIGPIGSDGKALTKVQKSDQIDWTPEQSFGAVKSTQFHVYKLKYRVGDQIQSAIQAMGDSIALSSNEESELLITINSLQWIESSNSLIYTGTPASIEKLTDFVDLIDVPVRQVLVEVLMVETTVNNALNFGVDWGTRFGGGEDAGSQAFLSAGSPLVAALDTTGIGATVDAASSIARSAGFQMGVIGRKLRAGCLVFNSIGAMVNMLHTDTKSNVVMNPKLLVEENTPAEVFFGINTRFQTQSIANDEGSLVTSNFEFRDVGSSLKVTPIIGANDVITLEIDQEVSTVVEGGTGDNQTTGSSTSGTEQVTSTSATTDVGPTTRKSNTKTRIHVPNGYFVIMSGMILDDETRTRTQIPCLGGIPGLGAAFSQKSKEGSKRNLLLFIRPLIVENEEIHHTTKRQQDIYKQKTPTRAMWEEETREALDYLNIKDTDPARKLRQY